MQGSYELTGSENFVEYLKSLGVNDADKINMLADSNSSMTVSVEGGKYTIQSEYGGGKYKHTLTLTPGETFEDEVMRGQKFKSVATVDGDKITVKGENGESTSTRVYDFSGGQLVITMSSSWFPGTVKRMYKKL